MPGTVLYSTTLASFEPITARGILLQNQPVYRACTRYLRTVNCHCHTKPTRLVIRIVVHIEADKSEVIVFHRNIIQGAMLSCVRCQDPELN